MSRLSRLAKAEKKPKRLKSEIYAYKRKMRIVSLVVTLVILASLIVLFSYYLLAYFGIFSSSKDDDNGTSNNTLLKAALVGSMNKSLVQPSITCIRLIARLLSL